MNSFISWLQQLDFSAVYQYVIIVPASLICIIFHEISHGLTALLLGDTTARDSGRLSINPLKHVDLWGLVMMAVFKFGWAKPVPINMRKFKHPVAGMAVTAAAGPISNLLLAWVSIFLELILLNIPHLEYGLVFTTVLMLLDYITVLSIGLAVFNIIPIPPLDGSKILNAVLPQKIYYRILRYEKYGFILIMVLLYTGFLDTPLFFCRSAILNAFYSSAGWVLSIFL